MDNLNKIINYRNKKWADNKLIPTWVDLKNIDLDQFYTKKEIALKCYESLISRIKKDKGSISNLKFIEPSAGANASFKLTKAKKDLFSLDKLSEKLKLVISSVKT